MSREVRSRRRRESPRSQIKEAAREFMDSSDQPIFKEVFGQIKEEESELMHLSACNFGPAAHEALCAQLRCESALHALNVCVLMCYKS